MNNTNVKEIVQGISHRLSATGIDYDGDFITCVPTNKTSENDDKIWINLSDCFHDSNYNYQNTPKELRKLWIKLTFKRLLGWKLKKITTVEELLYFNMKLRNVRRWPW